MSDNLDTLTDAQLSEVFAVELAGWARDGVTTIWRDGNGFVQGLDGYLLVPRFATSADAVLPYLQARYRWQATGTKSTTVVQVWTGDGPHPKATVQDITFARAACIALVRAKRAEKGGAS